MLQRLAGEELWANVYGTECLARIDTESGSVTGWGAAAWAAGEGAHLELNNFCKGNESRNLGEPAVQAIEFWAVGLPSCAAHCAMSSHATYL